MKTQVARIVVVLALLFSLQVQAGNIDQVTFFRTIQLYITTVDTTLVTQEGKRIRILEGTVLNVAGFTPTEVFVVSRKDKPNGFIKRTDIKPAVK